jgi:hypothetical protein
VVAVRGLPLGDVTMGADRPKPPAKCNGSWIEWALLDVGDGIAWQAPANRPRMLQYLAYAREELKGLRNELELFKATAK